MTTTETVCRLVASNKIAEIIRDNAIINAADLIYSIMLELAQSPHPALTIDQTIDLVCEENRRLK